MPHTPDGFVLEHKPVFDWNHVAVGRVTTAERDPKTRTMRRLTLELTPEARASLGTDAGSIDVPASYIFGMRRDAVTLDRSLTELRKIEVLHSILKK